MFGPPNMFLGGQFLRVLCLCTLVVGVLEAVPTPITCTKLADVHWNATNPIFRIDNTDHIIDVNKGNNPFEYDQVNIICPVYTPGTKEEDMERYIIYNVSKEEYDSCRITNPNPRIIAVCDKPHQVMYFTITFRSFTPQPGGLEFRPGQDYYFISTSTGGLSGLHQRIGGRCETHNMKVIFKVCCDPSKMTTTTSTTAVTLPSVTSIPSGSQRPAIDYSPIISGITKPGSVASTYGPAIFVPTSSPGKALPPYVFSSSTSLPPFWLRPYSPTRPPYKTYDLPADVDRKKPAKKTEDRDKLPNETRAKNEELVKNVGCDSVSRSRFDLVLSSLFVTCALSYVTSVTRQIASLTTRR